MSDFWASDALISFPEPPPVEIPVVTTFDGFGFSMNGMVHDITAADLEEMTTPMFAPEGFQGATYAGPIEGKRPRMDDDEAQ